MRLHKMEASGSVEMIVVVKFSFTRTFIKGKTAVENLKLGKTPLKEDNQNVIRCIFDQVLIAFLCYPYDIRCPLTSKFMTETEHCVINTDISHLRRGV